MTKILNYNNKIKKLQRLAEVLCHKLNGDNSVAITVENKYERLFVRYDYKHIYVHVSRFGLYEIHHDNLRLKFKLPSSVVDYLIHTHINNEL